MADECCNINDTVQEFYDYLKAYLIKRVQNVDLAEDLVQEVMLQLVQAHQKGNKVENMKAWLFQITRNTLSRHFKENASHTLDINSFQLDLEGDFTKVVTADFIVPMIGLLPEKYGRPLLMSDIENIPQKEIAEKLNISLTNAKARIQRGRKQLREMFTECCNLEFDNKGNFTGCTIKDSCEPLHKISDSLKKATDS